MTNLSAQALATAVLKTQLANGLTVLTKEVHTAPVVSAQVWYRVGSRDEAPGLNGISHLLEHLMFKGTHNRPLQFGRLFSALGSAFNAFTHYDVTAYFGTVSKNKLPALLALEADRMVNTVIDPEQLTSEKRVVISELQGYENSPEYRLNRSVMRNLYPDNPYGLPVGGEKDDVADFDLEAVLAHYHRYYRPANATLVITGDFDTATALAQVEETFGVIANPEPVTESLLKPADLAGTAPPLCLQEPGSAPFLQMAYPLPAITHPDVAAIDVMEAILGAGRSSRLYQAIVDAGIASSVGGYAMTLGGTGWYELSAVAGPEQDLATIEQSIAATITELKEQPITEEELQRAKTQLQSSFILRNRNIDSQANQLAYAQVITGDYQFSDRHLAAIAEVSADDVQRVAQTYLTETNLVIGRFEPTQITPGFGGAMGAQTSEDFSPGEPVDPATVAQYMPEFPPLTGTEAGKLPERITLPNGLRILLLADHSTPTVTVSGHVNAGNALDNDAKAGLACLTADNLDSGTTSKDALTLATLLEDRGIYLDFQSTREGLDLAGYSLAADLPLLLETLAEVLQDSIFPEKELELTRQQTIANLQIDQDDPSQLGSQIFRQTLYPVGHPYHSWSTIESVQAIQRQDVLDFYHQYYRPQNTILTLVGAFDPTEVKAWLTKFFGAWTNLIPATTTPTISSPPVPHPQGVQIQQRTLAGKSQTITQMGYAGIDRYHPLFAAAIVLNHALGGDTLSSRLGTEIRDRQGLTYGIYSYFMAGKYAGPFVIKMQTSPEDTQQAIQSTLALLTQLREQGLSKAEIEAAQRSIINSYPVDLANLDNLCQGLLMNEVYGLPLDTIHTFPDQIAAVTPAQISQAIEALIDPENMLIVSVGPA